MNLTFCYVKLLNKCHTTATTEHLYGSRNFEILLVTVILLSTL